MISGYHKLPGHCLIRFDKLQHKKLVKKLSTYSSMRLSKPDAVVLQSEWPPKWELTFGGIIFNRTLRRCYLVK